MEVERQDREGMAAKKTWEGENGGDRGEALPIMRGLKKQTPSGD